MAKVMNVLRDDGTYMDLHCKVVVATLPNAEQTAVRRVQLGVGGMAVDYLLDPQQAQELARLLQHAALVLNGGVDMAGVAPGKDD